ncbi:MAG: hypothetical protein WC340_02360 [Kiritimatiellia bacterium]
MRTFLVWNKKEAVNGIKTLFCISVAVFSLSLMASEKIVLHDEFYPGLQRSVWIVTDNPSEPWQLEEKIRFSHEKMGFRFISGKALMQRVDVVNAATGETVWQTKAFGQTLQTPVLPEADYIIRGSGKPGAEKVVIAVDFSRDGYLLPSWKISHAEVSQLPEGGIELKPLAPDQHAAIDGRILKLSRGRYYEVELAFESDQVNELLMRCTQRLDGKRHSETSTLTTGVGEQQVWRVGVAAISVGMGVSIQSSGAFRLRAFTVKEVPPPARRKQVGDKIFTFEPRNSEPDPPNPDISGPVAFRRPPRLIYEDSVPQPLELTDALDTFATPGTYAVWHFAVHNPDAPRHLKVLNISDLEAQDGHRIPAAALTISTVKFWDFPRGTYTYYNIPELIYPQEEVELDANRNRFFWIQTRLSNTCPAGVYTGIASVQCGETELDLSVRLRVLPFRLMTPTNMVWSVYGGARLPPQKWYPEKLVVRYLRDIIDYGVTSLVTSLGTEDSVRKFQSERRQAEMKGPVIVRNFAERYAARRCGITDNFPERWFDHPEIRQAFVEYLKDFDDWFKKYGGEGYDEWMYMGDDEPQNHSMESGIWQIRLAREAGIRTASCVYAPRYVTQMAPWLNISCNSFISQSETMFADLMKVAAGKPLEYWYLGGGCYSGQEGGVMPDRLESGLMSFKLGVTGHIAYGYQSFRRGRGETEVSPYDNFTRGKYNAMTYPAEEPTEAKVTVFSLEWEGIREGIADYKYLYTLREMGKQARGQGLIREADAAQKKIEEILASVPWRGDQRHYVSDSITEKQYFNNDVADKLRALAVSAILDLQKVLQ